MATMEGESTDGTLPPWERAVMVIRARRFDGLGKKTSQLERKRDSKEREAQQEKDEEE